MATASTLITTRLCLIDGGRAAFRSGAKLALLYCWLAVSIASAIRIFFVADDLSFLKLIVGSVFTGIFFPIFRIHIVLLAWGAGLFIGSIFILFAAMPKMDACR